MEDVVWTAVLDSIYKIKVVRTGEYTGQISITRGDELIRTTQVPLAYDAIFGPDVSDVMNWQNWSVTIVDGDRREV